MDPTNFVEKPSLEELISEADKYGIPYFEDNQHTLFFKLAGISKLPEFEKVEVINRKVSDKELERREKNNEQIPGKTVFPKRIRKKIYKQLEKNPLSFNCYDFTNPDNDVHFTFEKRVKCHCGENFVMSTVSGESFDRRRCPRCERFWVYLKV